ncbi:Uncharacterized conserved protein [Plasmopara halstedii]|uniref:Uncharacterized conserved protein n=1 Tax=Plasmopara halstedii TaxID=4781 RepID=A0A0P1A6J8_PLAHL|nr:Uncharacterized conserved protein [Plasmopara halstedii]CEG36241.1 Uncharacterized conserved protein [Plasmopara halstedii]|eukprot:XP_024572610.1 Uncharacterized conserved protein [Plasmopara halstedii]
MGCYTTLQTFSDQDAQGAAVAYDADSNAKDSSDAASNVKGGKLVVNRVDNVSGSSAGAGSGEFHTYRAARRREMDRIASMEQQYKDNKAQQEFEDKRKRKAEIFEAKMQKRTEKRRRRKERAKAKTSEIESVVNTVLSKEKMLETPGGVPEIPNDGSFLETMLALQKERKKEEKK